METRTQFSTGYEFDDPILRFLITCAVELLPVAHSHQPMACTNSATPPRTKRLKKQLKEERSIKKDL